MVLVVQKGICTHGERERQHNPSLAAQFTYTVPTIPPSLAKNKKEERKQIELSKDGERERQTSQLSCVKL